MGLKTFVKIGQISNLSDARYCAGMMVDILGFNLQKDTDGYVSPEVFSEITNWVAGVELAGEFSKTNLLEIKQAIEEYKLDWVQTQDIDQLDELSQSSVKIIFKLVISDTTDLDKLANALNYGSEYADLLILDCTDPSLHDQLYQSIISLDLSRPLLRSYDLSVMTAPAITDDPNFDGIELEGSPEDRPGFKDYGAVMDILEVLEED